MSVDESLLDALEGELLTVHDVHRVIAREPDPSLTFECLFSLLASRTTSRVRRTIHTVAQEHERIASANAERRLLVRMRRGESLSEIAREYKLPATELVRKLVLPELCREKKLYLPRTQLRPGEKPRLVREGEKVKLKEVVHEPRSIVDDTIRQHVLDAVDADRLNSPASDEARRLIGLEYEHVLMRKLVAAGVPFHTESQLKAQHAAKTPDFELPIPIEVDGRIVNWIDSKGTFADPAVHAECIDQYRAYVNRLGPGMVIYWCGYSSGLPEDDDVVVVDNFPARVVTARAAGV